MQCAVLLDYEIVWGAATTSGAASGAARRLAVTDLAAGCLFIVVLFFSRPVSRARVAHVILLRVSRTIEVTFREKALACSR
jgi:hypothetical protein